MGPVLQAQLHQLLQGPALAGAGVPHSAGCRRGAGGAALASWCGPAATCFYCAVCGGGMLAGCPSCPPQTAFPSPADCSAHLHPAPNRHCCPPFCYPAPQVGCGVGNTTFPLLEVNPSARVYACDYAPTAIQLVKANPEYAASGRVHAFVADITGRLEWCARRSGSPCVSWLLMQLQQQVADA